MKKHAGKAVSDEESGNAGSTQLASGNGNNEVTDVEEQTSVFHWRNVCYDVKIKGDTRRILDHVDGWVKPGTLTALMVSTKT
jgi:hypothetical protein